MSWREITREDVETSLSQPELVSYTEKMLAAGQEDPLDGIIRQVTAEGRGAAISCDRNVLHSDERFVPSTLIYDLVAIIRYRLLTRFVNAVNEDRKTEYRAALRKLERVADCKVRLPTPDISQGSGPSSNNAQIDVIDADDREFTQDRTNGLF